VLIDSSDDERESKLLWEEPEAERERGKFVPMVMEVKVTEIEQWYMEVMRVILETPWWRSLRMARIATITLALIAPRRWILGIAGVATVTLTLVAP